MNALLRSIPLATVVIVALLVLATGSVSAAPVNICDRTQEVQDAILGGLTGSPTCSTVTDTQLASITELDITGYSSASIVPGDFAGLAGLEALRITGSPLLTTVPANAFSEVTASLEVLRLYANSISSLHEDAFAGLTALTDLYLGNNSIFSLDADIFDGLSALEVLRLTENYIITIEDGTFEDTTALREIYLEYNYLSTLSKGTFAGPTALSDITLAFNRVSSIHEDTFEDHTALDRLALHGNDISSLHEDTFDGLTALTDLTLYGNRISSLHEDTFDGLTALRTLRLHANNLSELDADLFGGLTELQTLYLYSNSIETLDADLFGGLSQLRTLYLHRNSIETLDASIFSGLTALQTLALSYNSLSSLPSGVFGDLTMLRTLNLNDNSLASPQVGLFGGLTALTTLTLHRNGLASPQVGLFGGLTALTTLTLYRNGLASPPEDLFDGLTALTTLYLNDNGMALPPEDLFDGLMALQTLYLNDNGMALPPEDLFDGLMALQTLYLNDNGMASPPEDLFDGLTTLRTLYLNDNGMASLNVDLFDTLGDLSTLELSDNAITSLTAGVFEDQDDSLTRLYLRSNGLTALPSNIFTGLTGLNGLDLSCNALTALDLTRFDPFASTLTYLDVSGNSFSMPPTETALRAKLTNASYIYTGEKTVCVPPYDAGLSGLSIDPGALTPPFETAISPSFDAAVDSDVSKTTVTITPRDPNAQIEPHDPNDVPLYDDDPVADGWQVKLRSYRTTFQWSVRSANGASIMYYSLVVFRDRPPAVASVVAAAAVEGEPLEFVVTLSYANVDDTMVGYSVTGGTATAGTDYTAPAPGAVLTIPAGQKASTIAIATVADEMEENPETLTLTLKNPVNATLDPAKSTATGTIRDVLELLPATRLPSVDDPNALWLATLTVADLGSNEYGYNFAQCGRGGLTDTAFTYLGDDTPLRENQSYTGTGPLYTIEELSYVPDSNSLLFFLDRRFTQDTADNIFLDVGGTRLKFSDASYYAPSHAYEWTMPDPSWSVGEAVPVKIVVLKDADGPNGLAATTALVPTTGPTGAKYETRNLTLTWSAPTSGGAVTGYRVEYQPDPALQWRTLVASQTGTTYTQTGKLRRVVDYYRVAALRSGGVASYSDMVRVQVAPETSKIPERVGYLEAGPAPCSKLKLAWNRAYTPISKSGDGVGSGVRATGYQVQYALDDGGYPKYRAEGEDWLTVTLPRWLNGLSWRTWPGSIEEIEFKERRDFSPDLKMVVTGLAPDTNYRVRVRGCNDAGCGEWTIPKLAETSGAVSNATEEHPLTATLQDIPANHDGSSAFTFRIAFSADVTISPRNMRDHALIVSGGTVTGARRVDSRKDLWELTVAPAGTGAVSILAPQDRACTETGALCTAEGQMLSTGLGRSVPGPALQGQRSPAPLANSPATGAPNISGTAQVGETLTADTTDIADADGLSGATFIYRWTRNDGSTDTSIQDATGSSYTLSEADEGQTVKVTVSFADDADNKETLTSTATAEVAAGAPTDPPGAPRNLTGTANPDGTVTLSWDAPDDDTVTGYQILRRRPTEGENTLLVHQNDTGSTATEYTDSDVTPDVRHVYRVKAVNAAGLSSWSNFVRVTPTQPAEPAQSSSATGVPGISGTVRVGDTLTADTSGIADDDGLTNVSYGYQWIVTDGGADIDITSATDSSYTLADADEGLAIKVKVSFTDDAGNEESLTSAATDDVASAGPKDPPLAPENLTAEKDAGGSVTLTWEAPDDDSVTGYRILRRNADAGENAMSVYVSDTGGVAHLVHR